MSRRRRKAHTPPLSKPTAPVRWEIPDVEDEKALLVYPKRLPGRPSLLTPEAEGRFLGMLQKGVYRNVAAEACGLNYNTLVRWIRRGRGRDPERPPLPEYVQFVRRVEQAEAMARGTVEANVVARSKYDHNAGLAWLRTRYPDQWPRYPGGVDDEGPDNPFRAPVAPPMETTPTVQRQTNIILLTDDKWGELAHDLISQSRKQQEQRDIENDAVVAAEYEVITDDAPRHSRLDSLRAEDA